jgi:excisionase family DNA binding protein
MTKTELITIKPAAAMLGVSVATVRRWVKRGALPAYKPFTAYLFDSDELALFIRESKYRPETASESTKAS